MDEKILKLLYRSLDASLTDAEQAELQQALTQSDELRAEKKRIVALRKQLQRGAVRTFRPFFAERIVSRLERAKRQNLRQYDFFDSMVYVFRRVLVAAAVIVILLVSYNIIENNGLSMNKLLGFQEVTPEDVWLPIDTSTWENMQ
jgi:hypothetical protein